VLLNLIIPLAALPLLCAVVPTGSFSCPVPVTSAYPVPLAVILTLPFVSVAESVLPSSFKLSTSNDPVLFSLACKTVTVAPVPPPLNFKTTSFSH
jgi:hypothetical protein